MQENKTLISRIKRWNFRNLKKPYTHPNTNAQKKKKKLKLFSLTKQTLVNYSKQNKTDSFHQSKEKKLKSIKFSTMQGRKNPNF